MTPKRKWLHIAGGFDLNILYSPRQELFLNMAQPPSPTETFSRITHWVPAWGSGSTGLSRGHTANVLSLP